jgi:molybdate transport system substrate-binding protein
MSTRSFRATVLAATTWVVLPVATVAADEITLAAGAGFRRPLGEIASAYEAAGGHKVAQIYGHLGQVFAQARDSGRISLVCGDKAALDAAPGLSFTRFIRLGLGKLVIAYRKGLALADAADLAKPEIKRVGIPDQAQAIYGKAGRQFLQRSGLAVTVDPKLIAVATVPQVTSYIVSGEVDAGFVNLTDVLGVAANIGGQVEGASALYDPVEIVCATVSAAKDRTTVSGLADFIETPPARAILQRYGL